MEPEKKPESGPGITKKQELNNHIVLMRKNIRQAKVHIIRKLTREIKKLRERRGSEEVQQKCKRKADRIVQDIVSIKTFEEDKASIKALLNSAELNSVLQNTSATSEDRALIRIAYHPSVQGQVRKYRDGNPHWRLQIPVLLEKTPQKLKLAEKKAVEKLNRKKIRNIGRVSKGESSAAESVEEGSEEEEEVDSDGENKLEADSSVEEEEEESEGEGEEGSIESSASEEEEEELDSERKLKRKVDSSASEEELDSESEGKKRKLDSVASEEEDSNSENKLKKREIRKVSKTVKKAVPVKKAVIAKPEPKKEPKELDVSKLNKLEGTVKVQVIQDWSEFEADSKPETGLSVELPVKKPKSSFFVGGVDEPEEETVQPDVREPKPAKVPFERRNNRNNNKNNFQKGGGRSPWGAPQERPNLKWKMPNEPATEPKPERKPAFDRGSKPVKSERKIRSSKAAEAKPVAGGPPEKLHPSWEAKKRQSIGIPAFQGKKITFDD